VAFFRVDFVGRRALVRGDDWAPIFRWTIATADAAGMPVRTPVNLSGWSGTVRVTAPGSDALLIAPPPSVIVDSAGHIGWSVPGVMTAALPRGELMLYVPLVDPSGKVTTKILGRLEVL
jgi:hypothetical protein